MTPAALVGQQQAEPTIYFTGIVCSSIDALRAGSHCTWIFGREHGNPPVSQCLAWQIVDQQVLGSTRRGVGRDGKRHACQGCKQLIVAAKTLMGTNPLSHQQAVLLQGDVTAIAQ